MSYAKENASYPQPMKLVPIPRKKAGYHDTEVHDKKFASATAIRQRIFTGESVTDLVPQQTALDLVGNCCADWELLWSLLRYKIVSSSLEDLRRIYQMSEGLENRLKQVAGTAINFADFLDKIKSKRYTRVRLQRLCTYVLGNVTDGEIQQAQQLNGLRILGFTDQGRQFIHERKALPWISRFGQIEKERYALSLKMDQIYQLASDQISEQNFARQPLR